MKTNDKKPNTLTELFTLDNVRYVKSLVLGNKTFGIYRVGRGKTTYAFDAQDRRVDIL